MIFVAVVKVLDLKAAALGVDRGDSHSAQGKVRRCGVAQHYQGGPGGKN